ncbi:MAG TPA: O-antigen ligase family protein [Chitinophagales bacterium]|nr:O-antigen ligase family protein [Chitinophagales bacterium]HNI52972.1 O-antigen ligase family protein [Chitinophagales bacterium]HNJ88003.1 O-antigen ligase family protein [Chitinophagales bacterium]HNM29128.1 O-antigen ligase family protein [Chitinophagales bacterium]HNO27583.1 O-antigen ligase family protein [Chitinophagales bacterium]
MRSLLRVFPNQFFASLAILGLIVGLVTSKVVLSVATITLMCNAFINIRAGSNFRKWFSDTTAMLCAALFLVYLFSGFWSSDIGYWVDRCRMKLPFLAIPLGFTAVKAMSERAFHRWLGIYVVVIFGTSLVVLINYLMHYETLNHDLTMGQPIPAPLGDHIRFSLELAFAIICGGYLWWKRFYFFSPKEHHWWGIITIFLAVCIHVFAVRSGISALYLALLIVILHSAFVRKKYLAAGIGIVSLFVIGYCSATYIPSLKSRMDYFRYEITLIRAGDIKADHSDAQRLLSMEYGLQVARQNIFFGVGAGDIKTEMNKLYEQHAQSDLVKSKMPHNMYIYFLAATGMLGLLVFLLSVLYPWLSNKRYKNLLFSVFLVMMLFAFMAEHTLEIQLGTAYYLLFLLLIKKHIDDSNTPAYA